MDLYSQLSSSIFQCDFLASEIINNEHNKETLYIACLREQYSDAITKRNTLFNTLVTQQIPSTFLNLTIPQLIDRNEIHFLSGIVLYELLKMCATVSEENISDSKLHMINIISNAKIEQPKENIEQQEDSLSIINYYIHNTSIKKGLNISKIDNLLGSYSTANEKITETKETKKVEWKPLNDIIEIESREENSR